MWSQKLPQFSRIFRKGNTGLHYCSQMCHIVSRIRFDSPYSTWRGGSCEMLLFLSDFCLMYLITYWGRCERNISPPGIVRLLWLTRSKRLISVACRYDSLYLTIQSYARWTYILGDLYSYHTGLGSSFVSEFEDDITWKECKCVINVQS